MPMDIREIRADRVDEAVAFARAAGGKAEASAVIASLSLIAVEGDALVAVLLSLTSDDGAHAMELTPGDDADPALARRMIDTALHKARSHHLAKCRLRIVGDKHAAALWDAVNWTPGRIASPAAPINTPGKAA